LDAWIRARYKRPTQGGNSNIGKSRRAFEPSSGKLDVLTYAYARAGRRKDALRLLAELKRRKQVGYVPPASFVIAYIGLSDFEQAFAYLEQGYEEHSAIMQFLRLHPLFDPIRNDPRFGDLVRRVGFP
jgi:hypothetical protein